MKSYEALKWLQQCFLSTLGPLFSGIFVEHASKRWKVIIKLGILQPKVMVDFLFVGYKASVGEMMYFVVPKYLKHIT